MSQLCWGVRHTIFAVAMVGLTSCTMTPPLDESAEAARAQALEQSARVSTQCEALLAGLADTQPLLASLENTLNTQIPRIEQATQAALAQPEPAPSTAVCPDEPSPSSENKAVIGAIEWIYMSPPDIHYRARVDSGAETSSLSAVKIVEFERDGEDWVRFSFDHDGTEEMVDLELPIVRIALVRQASSSEPQRRVVVEIDVRFGDQLQTTEFTLTDRSNMTYPVLLGRAFLMDLYIVDVSQSYTRPKFQSKDA